MNPKEKAKELVEYYNTMRMCFFYQDEGIPAVMESNCTWHTAKQCALFAVDEILDAVTTLEGLAYWPVVKQEIELL